MTPFATRRRTMVDTQVRPSDVTKFPIIEALLSVPKEFYVPDSQREAAYVGENLALGDGRVVLDPRTMAKMLDVLDIQPDEMVLDIGCGLGYSSAVLAKLAEAVVAIEEDAQLANEAQATLSAEGVDNVAVLEAALTDGAAKHGPYDVVVIQGAVAALPTAITDQVKEGGRIICLFMEGNLGVVRLGHKSDGNISWRQCFNASAPVLPGFAQQDAFVL
jgi:protein-L-isoaspartate(D-aspartate) O-methyltransferase